MLRKLFTYLFLISSFTVLIGQGSHRVFIPEGDFETSLRWDGDCLIADYFVPEVSIVKNDHGYIDLVISSHDIIGNVGSPALLSLNRLIELEAGLKYQLNFQLLDSVLVDLNDFYSDTHLMCVQPSKKRTEAYNSLITLPDSEIYSLNEWYGPPAVNYTIEGTLRGIQIAHVAISPFKYNPQTKQLIIYTSIHFEMKPSPGSSIQEKVLPTKSFNGVYQDVLMKNRIVAKKKLVSEKPISMIVLSDSLFADALKPYLRWKREKGIEIIEVYVDEVTLDRDFDAIKDSLRSLYMNPPEGVDVPSYLTIVGESSLLPISSSWDMDAFTTDLYYTTYDEPIYVYDSVFVESVFIDSVLVDSISDFLPEMFYGRISVKNEEQLGVVLDKIMQYELYQMPDDAYLNRSVLVAGSDGYASLYGNGQLQYAADHYLNEEHGIDALQHYYPNDSEDFSMARSEISEGVGYVNYTGHGSVGGWIESSGTVTLGLNHLNEMPSNEQYAMYVVNACLTNGFRYSSDCLGEALLKAKGKGAIGYIGSTSDSYWDEDFYWAVGVGANISYIFYDSTSNGFYDKVFHERGEDVAIWTPSMGEMIFGGNMAVMEADTDLKRYYWEIYQLMGDPSVVPWFKQAEEMDVVFPSEITEGATTINIEAEAYDYCAISYEGLLLDAKHAGLDGLVELNIPDSLSDDQLLLVVSGDTRRTFVRNIPDVGCLDLLEYSYVNESVSDDGVLSNCEGFSFKLKISNTGINETGAFDLGLRTEASELSLNDSIINVASIPAGESLVVDEAFSLKTMSDVNDLSEVKFSIQRIDDNAYNVMHVYDTLHAPVLLSRGLSWHDRLGIPNGIPEAGEQLTLLWDVQNVGSYPSDSLEISCDTISGDSILEGHLFPKPYILGAGELKTFSFEQTLKEDASMYAQYVGPFVISDSNYLIQDSMCISPEIFALDFMGNQFDHILWNEIGWIETEELYYTYPGALYSGKIEHLDTSILSVDVYLTEVDSMSFMYRVSSEADYDFFHFYEDTAMLLEVSGTTDWERYSLVLDTGWTHLQWEYVKDKSVSRGFDAAFIDHIVFPSSGITNKDLAIQAFASPLRDPFFGESEGFGLSLWNIGKQSVDSFDLVFQLDSLPWVKQHFKEVIQVDSSVSIFVNAGLDLSELGPYDLKVAISVAGDGYFGNDSLRVELDHYAYPDLSIRELGFDSVSAAYCDLIIEIENAGNLDQSEWTYELRLDEEVIGESAQDIALAPMERDTLTIRLLSEDDGLALGWHSYKIVSEPDSLLSNNTISGEVYWNVVFVEEEALSALQIYPNPFREFFTLELSDELELPCQVAIYSLSGEKIFVSELYEKNTSFNSSELFGTEGIYILRIVSDNRSYEAKVEMIR